MEMAQQSGMEGESLLRSERHPIMVQGKPGRWESGEGDRLLRNEPVKLTPAWEGANLPNDTLNLKGVNMDLAPPKDKWRIIYFTLMLHGLGTLTAWNMFITANSYFVDYKLVNAPAISTNFLSYLGYAAQLPNLAFSWFNCFVTLKGNLATRIIWSLMMEVLLFVVTIALAMINSEAWPVAFFWITMATVFIMNAFNAIFQNSVFGVAARLPPSYTGAVVLGSNVCGTLVVLLQWLASAAGDSPRTSAIYYFIGGMFVLLVCFDTYFALPLNRFYRYYDTIEQRTRGSDSTQKQPTKVPYGTIFKKSWVQLYNIFSIFFVSLAVFPAVQTKIKLSSEDFIIKDQDSFDRFTCFLTFNVMAMIGNITGTLWRFPSRRWLVVFTSVRYLLIPVFLVCNYSVPGRTLPILITNDWLYWFLAALLGWSSGHGSSLGMMYVGQTVPSELSPKAGMIGGATLVTGIVAGIAFSNLCPLIVSASFWSGI